MPRRPHRFSLFAQPLDRAAFVAYFLGAVVPLAALAWVLHRYVRPNLQRGDALAWLATGLAAIGALSLVAFLALRRSTRQALARLDGENRRLGALLGAARSLAAGAGDHDLLRSAAAAAAEISAAHAGFYLTSERDERLTWTASSSLDARFARPAVREAIEGACENALETLAPAIRGAEAGAAGEGGGGLAMAVPCAAADGRPGALAVWHDDARPLEPASGAALSTLAALVTVALRNAAHHESERNFFAHATNLLVSALDAHLAHQTDHSRRVAHLSNRIGRRLELSEARLERLHFAALLHDIGMLRVDPGRVGDRDAVRRHPEFGAEMLKPIKLWEDLAPIVRHHHEWTDGSGYPDGLRGERIPLESRIIAVAEAFDALTSEQSYQRPIPVEEAIGRIEAGSGVQFDAAVVGAFVALRADLATL